MKMIVFSKDRPFQLHTALESIKKYVSGYDELVVQFNYSEQKFNEGYIKLNQIFDDVTFVDEQTYGFAQTLHTLLATDESEVVAFEVDDTIYFKEVDLRDGEKAIMNHWNASKFGLSLDLSLFDESFFTKEENKKYVGLDRNKDYGSDLMNSILKYPFNVSACIHRRSDVLDLFHRSLPIHPVDLEIKGSSDLIFCRYPYNLYNEEEVMKQVHFNNSLNRYEQMCDTHLLNEYFEKGEVLDLSKINMNDYESDMRWFNGEDIGRFPIFPWEIAPQYHKDLINNRRKI